jgi:hypothetical protein
MLCIVSLYVPGGVPCGRYNAGSRKRVGGAIGHLTGGGYRIGAVTQNWDNGCLVRRDCVSELEGLFTGISIDLECVCIRRGTRKYSFLFRMFILLVPPTWTLHIFRLPRFVGLKGMWEQAGPCIICGRRRYSRACSQVIGMKYLQEMPQWGSGQVKAVCALSLFNCL